MLAFDDNWSPAPTQSNTVLPININLMPKLKQVHIYESLHALNSCVQPVAQRVVDVDRIQNHWLGGNKAGVFNVVLTRN